MERADREGDVTDEARAADESRAKADIIEDALFDLWSVANQLAQIPPADDRYRVTIFGSARVGPDDPGYQDVRRLSARLSSLGCDIITGGGPGLMQAANEGAQIGDPDDETRSVGIRVALPFEQGANPFVEKVYTHRTFFSRLHHFVRVSNAYVVMPGGLGTTLELVLVWQLMQVRHLTDIPMILVGPMWRELTEWARRHMVEVSPRFADPKDVELPRCVDSVDEAAEIIESHYLARHGENG
jgi:uncharacterized protein (TIGR00730 family)